MPKKKYLVDLTAEERTSLEQLLQKGKSRARNLTRARILLQAAEGVTDEEGASALGVSSATVERTRQRCVETKLEALNELPRSGGQRKLSGKPEAYLIAVACPPAPPGQPPWTLQLLADQAVEVGFVQSLARATVRQGLKKTPASRGCTSRGVCPQ
jgi:transposase